MDWPMIPAAHGVVRSAHSFTRAPLGPLLPKAASAPTIRSFLQCRARDTARHRRGTRSLAHLLLADDDAVATELLCLVERSVRDPHYGLDAVAMVGKNSDADRHGDRPDEPALILHSEPLHALP